ncbi:MAG: VanW family protein [Clostridia bacterium]|nr:VanW family protein [Clostridia bacterium]
MKGRLKKLFVIILASAFAAGAFIFCALDARLPAGVYMGGVDVGGLTRRHAAEAVREDILNNLKGKSLTVHSGGDVYVFRYPEINFKDDAAKVAQKITSAGKYAVNVRYYLNGLDGVVSGICTARSQVKREPCAIFNPAGGAAFEYESGKKGVYPDKARLAADIKNSLGGSFADVYLHTREFSPSGTLGEVMQSTVLLSSFTTYFDGSNADRAHNIALAARRISGCVLRPEGVFSFNESVGARTKERGFKIAKVIMGGRYVYGIGGGVCQVSTTLYNAALLAGLKVTEYHPHSLPVSYVSPSRDAMVSGTYCDLKCKNISDCPVYIRVLTGNNYVRCEIYGKSSGYTYSLDTEYLENAENGGIRSRCFLTSIKDGESVTSLLRTDSYLPDARHG